MKKIMYLEPDLETAENDMQIELIEYTYRLTTNSTIDVDKKRFSCSNYKNCPKGRGIFDRH